MTKTTLVAEFEVDGPPARALEGIRRVLGTSPGTAIISTVLIPQRATATTTAVERDTRRYRRLRAWGVAPNAGSGITAVVFRSQALDTFVDRDLEQHPAPEEADEPDRARKIVAVATLAIDGPQDAVRKIAGSLLEGSTDSRSYSSGAPSLRAARAALLAEWEATSPYAAARDALRYRRLLAWGYAPRSGRPTLICHQALDDLLDRDLEIHPAPGSTAPVADPGNSTS
jgi:hypothetical protein